MTNIPNQVDLTPVPLDTQELAFLATGSPGPTTASSVHIGGGVILGHNHRGFGDNPTLNKDSQIASGLNGEVDIVMTQRIDFSVPEEFRGTREGNPFQFVEEEGGRLYANMGHDTSLAFSTGAENAAAAPLLILSDPQDLVGTRAISVGVALIDVDAQPYTGMVYATGSILEFQEYDESENWGGLFVTDADVVGGMSGSGLFVELDTNGDGNLETYTIGTLSRAAGDPTNPTRVEAG